MPVPSAQLGLPQIAGTDTPDIPRDINAIIARFEATRNTFATRQILEVGQVGQIKAGRALAPADFTSLGLVLPPGIFGCGSLTNQGSGAALVNKGAVPFAPGILGAASEAAQFVGSTAQALYIADTGAADPFRIRTGSWGCWFRTAKRGQAQYMMGKWANPGGFANGGWDLGVGSGNALAADISNGTATTPLAGMTDVADGRWHFAVVTYDGTKLRMYVDGQPDNAVGVSGPINTVAAPFNIGGLYADAGLPTTLPFYGVVDEAFATPDVLSEDQVRYLMCASLPHTLGIASTAAQLNVRRRKRGAVLATTEFPATPPRIYNLVNDTSNDGSDADGTQGTTATLLGNVGTGAITYVAAPDGIRTGAIHFTGAHQGLSGTDTGLPPGLAARSYGIWFKGVGLSQGIIGWGTVGSADARLALDSGGLLQAFSGSDAISGPRVSDGLWHHGVVVEDNAAADAKRKLYLDGRLVGGSMVMNTLTLAGANRFRVGANPDGTGPLTGSVGRPFVYAGALTSEQVLAIYNVSGQALPASPKDEGYHIEGIEATRILLLTDRLEACDQIDLVVMA